MTLYCLKYQQNLPISLQECWDFFSEPANLKIITPEHLQFEITYDADNKMYAGQIISHMIRPLWGISIEWITEITHVVEPTYFIDEQRFGPYKFWHHEHRFMPIYNGVEMSDIIYYKMPYGLLGKAIHSIKVQKDLRAIFDFRRTKLENLFGIYSE